MQKIVSVKCPRCNNSFDFHLYGFDKEGYQKYKCLKCNRQFAPDNPKTKKKKNYPRCPKCGKATFLHHDYPLYSNYRCCDKKCNHSMFKPKGIDIPPASISKLVGKHDFKRMRFPVHTIISALYMYFIGKNSFRGTSLIMKVLNGISVSHTTIGDWARKFAPLFHSISLELIPMLNFDSDEWHADETVVKIMGQKYYIWFIVDSETRFVLGYHLSKHRDSTQASSLFDHVKSLGDVNSLVTDRYAAYDIPIKFVFDDVNHIKVESFKDDISNNLIEAFHHQFKAWYNTKQGFHSFESANNLIFMFTFFYNFIRPHSSLNNWTPAEVAGLNLSNKQKLKYLLKVS